MTDDRLNFFKNRPIHLNGDIWFSKNEDCYPVFDMYLNELYLFISCDDKEPTLIQDILDKYEVDENEKLDKE